MLPSSRKAYSFEKHLDRNESCIMRFSQSTKVKCRCDSPEVVQDKINATHVMAGLVFVAFFLRVFLSAYERQCQTNTVHTRSKQFTQRNKLPPFLPMGLNLTQRETSSIHNSMNITNRCDKMMKDNRSNRSKRNINTEKTRNNDIG